MRQSALNADFGGAELPGFDGLLRDLIRLEEICVGLARAAAEGAELASHKTDVGEVDVAIHDVGDEVAAEFGAQQVGGGEQAEQVVAFGVSQGVSLFLRNGVAVLSFENSFQRGAHCRARLAARCRTSRGRESFPVPTLRVRGARVPPNLLVFQITPRGCLLARVERKRSSGTGRWPRGEADRECGRGPVRREIRE